MERNPRTRHTRLTVFSCVLFIKLFYHVCIKILCVKTILFVVIVKKRITKNLVN
jgi:hypothetical protein